MSLSVLLPMRVWMEAKPEFLASGFMKTGGQSSKCHLREDLKFLSSTDSQIQQESRKTKLRVL